MVAKTRRNNSERINKEIEMKRSYLLILATIFLWSFSACSSQTKSLIRDENSYIRLAEAQQTVALALEYHDQGGYEKSSELFLDAADKFRELNAHAEERRALIAAAKVQLKCSHREVYLLTMARFKGLLGRLEMPSEEERFLVNLADHMSGRPLTYPVKSSWQAVFK